QAVRAEHESAVAARRDGGDDLYAKAAPSPTGTVLIDVKNTGIQRVTYESLLAAGVAVDSSDKLFLSNGGVAVPLFASSKKMGPGTFAEFYGQALDTTYTDTNVYVLQVGGSGKQTSIQQADGTPGLVPAAPASYTETFTLNRHTAYANYAPSDNPW